MHVKYDQSLGFSQFCLALYLKLSTRWEDPFIDNTQHLHHLKFLIVANLPERIQNTENSSYFSGLSAWIKSARNRK